MAACAVHGAAEKGPGKGWGRWRSSPGIHSHGRFGWRRTREAYRREEVELGRRSHGGRRLGRRFPPGKARARLVVVRWRCGTQLGRLSRKEMDERRPKMAGAVRAGAQLELGLKGGARAE